MIIHLNGMPGVGKLTIAKLLAEKINARLIDNHLILDLVLTLCERGSPEYLILIRKFTVVVLEAIKSQPHQIYIFTNALAAEIASDRERFDYLNQFAIENEISFFQIFLSCDLEENKRRVTAAGRELKGKLMNSEELEGLYQRFTIYHPPAENALTIDTTNSSAENVAEKIKIWLAMFTKL